MERMRGDFEGIYFCSINPICQFLAVHQKEEFLGYRGVGERGEGCNRLFSFKVSFKENLLLFVFIKLVPFFWPG